MKTKIKHILLQVRTLDDMSEEFKNSWKKAILEKVAAEATESICFDSAEDEHKVLSSERIRLLNTIQEKKPKPIIELAKIVGRVRKDVTEDIKMLAGMGLISRKPVGKNMEKIELVFDI